MLKGPAATEEEINNIIAQPSVEKKLEKEVIEENIENDAENIEQGSAQKEQPTEEEAQAELEQKARNSGWNPDYKGLNKKSAKEFLEDGMAIKKRLERENEALRKYNETLVNTSTETIKKLKQESEKRLAELEIAKKTAKENLDMEGLENIIKEQDKIKDDSKKLEQSAPAIDPTVLLWAEENKDFVNKVEGDPVLNKYADSVALSMREELLKVPPAERFQKIMERVKEDLPHKFSNPNQNQAPKTLTLNRTPGMQKPNSDKLSISTLPKEIKEGYDLVVKAQRFKTVEEKKAFDERFIESYKIMKGEK